MNPHVQNYNRTEYRIEYLNESYRFHVPDGLNVSGIYWAVLEGDLRKIERWIELGRSINERENSYGFYSLHLAVIKNNVKILEYLLTKDNVQVDCTCFKGKTPLYLATALGHTQLVEKLIQAGSNINILDSDNRSPLHISVHHPDVCHLLIRHGAPIDAVDDKGRSPLHYAVEHECIETIHMLLYYNADANVVDASGFTPFMNALNRSKVGVQEILLEYVDNFNRTYRNYMPGSILTRALRRNSPFVKDIIERGADVNYSDVDFSDITTFVSCLITPVDSSTFKLVWDKLRYDDTKRTVDLLRLLYCLKGVPSFLQVIIESDNFEVAVQYFTTRKNYDFFIYKFVKRKFDLDQLTALTCRLLQHGFRVTSHDIYAIFSSYGYCELFRILLYMDNDLFLGWQPHMTLCRSIYDVHYKLEGLRFHTDFLPKRNLLQLFEYFICPSLIDALSLRFNNNEYMSAILGRLPKVPSLIELARNAARKHIWQAFRIANNCQFYTTIDHLNIPGIYKNILTFKRKLYMIG